MQLERLEDRLAPTIDIFAGASGSQAQDAAFIAANGVISAPAASLSTGALQAIGATNNISITATAGDIVFHANLGTVNLLQTGGTDAFAATAGAITFTTPTDTLTTAGAGFKFSAGTNVSTAGLKTGAGDIFISSLGDLSAGTLSAPAGTVVLTSTNGAIRNNPVTATVTAALLDLQAGNGVSLTGPNAVSVALTGNVGHAGQSFVFNSAGDLAVGNVEGLNGITTNGGPIALSLTGLENLLTIRQSVDSTLGGEAPAGANITFSADNMAINSSVNAGAAIVTLKPTTAGRPINLGANDVAGTLGLAARDLTRVAAGVLRVGSTAAGNLTVSAAIGGKSSFTTLTLISKGVIAETGTGAILASNLDAQGAGGVNLGTNPSTINDLAGSSSNHSFVFVNSTALTVGKVDTQSGINVGAGAVGLRTNAGAILNGLPSGTDVTAGSVGLNGNGGIGAAAKPLTLAVGSLGAFTANAAMFLYETGTATLTGAGLNAGTNTITLLGGTFALSANNQIAAASALSVLGATLNMGAFSDTIAALTLNSTATLSILINAFTAGNYGSLLVTGAINLGNAVLHLTLSAAFPIPTTSASITLIGRIGNTPIVGQFATLPNNSTFMLGTFIVRINYT